MYLNKKFLPNKLIPKFAKIHIPYNSPAPQLKQE
jgi:hypothetical protein